MSDDPAPTAVSDADADSTDSDTGGDDGSSPARDIDALRTVADYQFGAGAGTTLFPTDRALRDPPVDRRTAPTGPH